MDCWARSQRNRLSSVPLGPAGESRCAAPAVQSGLPLPLPTTLLNRTQNYRDWKCVAKWGAGQVSSDLAALVVRRGEDQRPVNLVFRGGRVHSRNAHTGRSSQQHVGTVWIGVPPARKRFRQSVIAS